MNLLDITLPGWSHARVLYNSLYDSLQPSALTSDVLLVELPDDVFVDVGWYPERDPTGQFRICVFQGTWDNRLVCERTASPQDVAARVSRLVLRFAPQDNRGELAERPPGLREIHNVVSSATNTDDWLIRPQYA
jgi:hypothetical protein